MHARRESYSPWAVDSKAIKGPEHHPALVVATRVFERDFEKRDFWRHKRLLVIFQCSTHFERSNCHASKYNSRLSWHPRLPCFWIRWMMEKSRVKNGRGGEDEKGSGNFPEGKMAKRIFAEGKMVCPPHIVDVSPQVIRKHFCKPFCDCRHQDSFVLIAFHFQTHNPHRKSTRPTRATETSSGWSAPRSRMSSEWPGPTTAGEDDHLISCRNLNYIYSTIWRKNGINKYC